VVGSNTSLTTRRGRVLALVFGWKAALRKAGASTKQLALIRGLVSLAPNDWLAALTL
jgi:hypothetical protein